MSSGATAAEQHLPIVGHWVSDQGCEGPTQQYFLPGDFRDATWDVDTERLNLIHRQEHQEPTLNRLVRRVAYEGVGPVATLSVGVLAGREVFKHTRHAPLPTRLVASLAVAYTSMSGFNNWVQEPIIQALHDHHQRKNPLSPAAQSAARRLQELRTPFELT